MRAIPTVTFVALALVLALHAGAGAGVYTVHSCRLPDNRPASAEGWGYGDARNYSLSSKHDDCAGGDPWWIEMNAGVSHPANDYVRTIFFAPPDTEIREYTIWRSMQLSDLYHVWFHHYRAGVFEVQDTCFAEDGCRAVGTPNDPLSPANMVTDRNLVGVTGLDFLLTCGHADGGSSSCASAFPTGRLRIHRSEVTILDQHPPVLTAAPSGPLVQTAGPLSGLQAVSLSASDRGGGVYKAMAEVDGRVVAETVLDPNGGRCREPFTAPRPCKTSAAGQLALDTAALPDGDHSLRLLVSDATGATAAWGLVGIRTQNSNCTREPRVKTLELRARFGRAGKAAKRGRRRVITVRQGRRLHVRGRLTTPQGQPVAGVPLCVTGRVKMGGAAAHAQHVVTDAKGRFSYRLRATTSRRIWFVHAVAGGAVTANVVVQVRAPVTLSASPLSLRNGQTMQLRGRIEGGPRPRGGAIVEIQARFPDRWQTIATTRARESGRFRYSYRFTGTKTAVQRYRFRARVPSQPGFPYAAGGSRAVAVIVAP